MLADVQLTLIDSLDDVLAFREWLGSRRPDDAIGFDTETAGLDTRRDRVRLIQFGDTQHGWALARDDWQGVARQVFKEYTGRLIGHNAPFDTSMLHHSCDIDVPRSRVDDTMKMARVNEPHFSMALKSQAARHVDPAAAGLQVELGKATGWTWATVPIEYEPYWMYGALDPVLTYALDQHHRPIVQAEAPRAYDLEMQVGWVVERMEDYGVCVDVENSRRLHDEFTDYCRKVERWCVDAYGVKPGSNAAVIKVLESEGFTFTKATASGAKALDVDVLGPIDHPLAQAVLSRRQLQKMASTYLSHYANESDNGILHPSINTLGALTSRMSMSNPNLQNLPRHGTTRAGDVVREMIISRYCYYADVKRDEYNPLRHGALLMCDFSQIEMRLLAHLANEPAMIEAFKTEGDFFVNLARQIFADPTLMKKDPRRQITKNAGYATIYGAGIAKFAQTAGVTQRVARDFMSQWQRLYPRVGSFQQRTINDALELANSGGECETRSPLTNRRFIADRRKAYALVNYVVQGTAAEILKMKIVELDAAGLGEFMVAPVHDEVILDVPPEHVRDAVHTLRSVMNDDKLLSVPITAEVSYGRTWGEKRDWIDADW